MLTKKDFPLFKNQDELVYLDAAATSQKPDFVIDEITNWYLKSNANIHRGLYDLSFKATQQFEQARLALANIFNVNAKEIIFTKGTTESLNLLAHGLQKHLRPGQNIVVSALEHHSNLLPWKRVSLEIGLELRILPLLDGRIDMTQAKRIIDNNTAVVAIAHASNVLGTLQPVKEIAQLTHQNKAWLIVDGAQAVPHLPVDIKKLGVDAYVFSGHKAYGPNGVGVAFIKKDLGEIIDPLLLGGEMVQSVSHEKIVYREQPWRFEAGTQDPAAVLGLVRALTSLQKDWPEIIEKEKELAVTAREILLRHRAKILSPSNAELPLISFTMNSWHPHDIGSVLNENHIAVRTGFACAEPLVRELSQQGIVRISFGLWNETSDLEKLDKALAQIK